MTKAYQNTISALFILLLILFVSSPVQAGDETRDKAIAIGVGLLATGIEMLSQPSEQQDNTEATKVTQKPKAQIQYSKEVANVQSNLKDLGFYHGSIDGLKGQQTYQAIEAWRQSVNSEDTGELNIY